MLNTVLTDTGQTVLAYPHQKVIRVNKSPCNKENLYAKINLDAMRKASKDFAGRSANAFILWAYLAGNQDNYCFALSQEAVELTIGLKEKAYDNAVASLIEKGYLQQVRGQYWNFFEIPAE